jgi:hypothetical protein
MGRKVDNTKKPFEQAIVRLVIRLSHDFNGRWFTAKDMRALLVAGGIQDDLTDTQVTMALRFNNNCRLLDNRNDNIRYFRSINIIDSTMPTDQSSTLPTIAEDYFLSAEFIEEMEHIRAYLAPPHTAPKTLEPPPALAMSTPQPTDQEPKLPVRLLPRSPSGFGTSVASYVLPVFVSPPPRLLVSASVPSHSPVNKKCRGWTGTKYDSLFKVSYCDFVGHSVTMASPVLSKDHPPIDLPPAFLRSSKSSDKLHFKLEGGQWVLRSKECSGIIEDGSSKRKHLLCSACKPLKLPVSKVASAEKKLSTEIHSRMQIDPHKLQLLGPTGQFKLLQEVRREKTLMQKAAKMREKRLRAALEKNSSEARHENLGSLQKILSSALPLFEKVCTKEEMEVVRHSKAILDGRQGQKGVPYHDAVITRALELLDKCDRATYEELATELFLPSHRHIRKIKSKLVSEGVSGFRKKITSKMSQACKDNGWLDEETREVLVTFDGYIMRGNFLLSTKKGEENRIIGCDLPSSDGITERLFKDFVEKMKREADGIGNIADKDTFASTLAEALPKNREHIVFYAKSIKPGRELCFICATFNLPTVKAKNVWRQLREVIFGLEEFDFIVRVVTADACGANSCCLRDKCKIRAKNIISAELLQKFGLDGNFKMAFRHPTTLGLIFFVSDPPHALKRVSCALENRELVNEGSTMKMEMLFDAWVAINEAQGENNLVANRKIKFTDFHGTNYDKMNVHRAARVLSGTMESNIVKVCNEPERYPMAKCPPGWTSADRHGCFSKVRELVSNMDRFFDLCNSKDPKCPIVRILPSNGLKYCEEFLGILAWFERWYEWVQKQNCSKKAKEQMFLPMETFSSLRYICYGFVGLISLISIKKGRCLTLCRINQDIVEHHFGNLRANVRSHSLPDERQSEAGADTSCSKRLSRVLKGNCSVMGENRTIVPVTMAKKKVSLKRRRSLHRKTENKKQVAARFEIHSH